MFPGFRKYLPIGGGSNSGLLDIETEERPGGMVTYLSGEVDLANVGQLKDAIQPALRNCRNIVLDVSKLSYIDSSGMHVLINAHKALQDNNCQLVVVGASPIIAKVMRVLGCDGLMLMTASPDEAMKLLQTKSSGSAADG